ncbi:hypothetical protein GCM10010381_35650 [Streptomyces xantholiticus]|nr:hypothetical protein GCM10010381_35650 [Streptomyces xantholiticus]
MLGARRMNRPSGTTGHQPGERCNPPETMTSGTGHYPAGFAMRGDRLGFDRLPFRQTPEAGSGPRRQCVQEGREGTAHGFGTKSAAILAAAGRANLIWEL